VYNGEGKLQQLRLPLFHLLVPVFLSGEELVQTAAVYYPGEFFPAQEPEQFAYGPSSVAPRQHMNGKQYPDEAGS
jgi:hypothetical protein